MPQLKVIGIKMPTAEKHDRSQKAPDGSVDAVGVLFEGLQGTGVLHVPELDGVVPTASQEEIALRHVPVHGVHLHAVYLRHDKASHSPSVHLAHRQQIGFSRSSLWNALKQRNKEKIGPLLVCALQSF